MDSIPPASSLRSVSQVVSSGSTSEIAADIDEFLVLLTAQLQNQDPLDPMDPSQFTDQLTQLSQLEQAAEQTEQLESVNAALAGLTARADALFLGRTVETTTQSAVLVGGEARLTVELDEPAETLRVEVFNASGTLAAVLEENGAAGIRSLVWDGRDLNGTVLPDGIYTVRASAVSGDVSRDAPVLLAGTVEEVRYTEAGAYARLSDGTWTPLDQTRAVALPAT